MLSTPTMFGVGIVLVVLTLVKWVTAKPKGRLPPGPKGLPIVGNVLNLPPPGLPEYRHWLGISKKYGSISSVTLFGQTIVLLNDQDMTVELLEKRGNIYSERPQAFFSSEMCGWKPFLGALGNNALLRASRRDDNVPDPVSLPLLEYALTLPAVHGSVGSITSLVKKQPVIEGEGKRFLIRAMQQQDEWKEHLKRYTGAIILNIAYGYNVDQTAPDPLVDLAVLALGQFADSVVPGKWMVDIFNSLQYVPSWFPGAGFKKTANRYARVVGDFASVPMKFTEARIEEGRAEPCMIADLLDKKLSREERDRIMRSAGAIYAGGADTTMATLHWFFVAMASHPEAQRKAQEEIDQVVGPMKLAGFEHRDRLPYVEAIWWEVMRWNTISQLGLPHAVLEDDEYQGYHIPKGSMVLAHTGSFLHDPKVYKDPELFRPERYLGSNPEPTPTRQFGYGKRVCPGKGLADQSGWLLIAQTLSAFIIREKVDQNGNKTPISTEGKPGLIYHAPDFVMDLQPRSEKHAEMLRDIEKSLTWDAGDSDELKKMGTLGTYE